ncbi:MAG: large conductance mechanosensitive channel protein MscL [Chloroflexi bacterium]|nr:large conductance mechanosensitive channel protein MscL [Chloroflexota bacterium]
MRQGNVLDLAVALVIGAAFTAIAELLVNDIFMPLIGILLGGIDFATLEFAVGNATVTYGNFVQAVVNFLIVALFHFSWFAPSMLGANANRLFSDCGTVGLIGRWSKSI